MYPSEDPEDWATIPKDPCREETERRRAAVAKLIELGYTYHEGMGEWFDFNKGKRDFKI